MIAFSCLGDYDNARKILGGLRMVQSEDGSFPSSVSAKTGEVYNSAKYTGANAWIVMAVDYYTIATGDNSYVNMAKSCANWFLQFKDTDGGIKGGINASGFNFCWKSTEHNLDAYSALLNLCHITDDITYCDAAVDVRRWIETEEWNDLESRFCRGENCLGEIDCYCALDVNPWTILALGTEGPPKGADYRRALDWAYNNCRNSQNWSSLCGNITNIEGFDFDCDCDTVWIEGTESMSCALFHANYSVNSKNSDYFHRQIEKLHAVTGDGGLPYTTNPGTVDENGELSTTCSSVAGTAWYIFAEKQLNPFETIKIEVFDTGPGTYPSIMGTHNGTIKSAHDVNISKMFTYPCAGTGGHSEWVAFYNSTTGKEIAIGTWKGYSVGDHQYIKFDKEFVLHEGVTYNYTIRTGSYPQIIHEHVFNTASDGEITCTKFVDANGKVYDDWIPAIRLE